MLMHVPEIDSNAIGSKQNLLGYLRLKIIVQNSMNVDRDDKKNVAIGCTMFKITMTIGSANI